MNDQEFPIKDAVVKESKGGKVVTGTINPQDVDIPAVHRPKQPWNGDEATDKWNDSIKNGHRQLAVKCMTCGLEFALFSWRNEMELMEKFEPSHGKDGGFCKTIHCPECAGMVTLWIGIGQHPGTIMEQVSKVIFGPPKVG